ncbi:MAG TPA: pilus assembly protein PilC [Alphaproteobacteria bacterium]|nr:pilus assembly protein PilC [Alphaproteobacteria bacterium]
MVEADTEEKAIAQISKQGIIVTEINLLQGKETGSEQKNKLKEYKASKIANKDKVIFTKKLATMIKSGLPIMKTLKMLEEQAENPHLKLVAHSIRTSVEGGNTLSEAFSEHKLVFDTIYINLIKAGETSGKLTVFLSKLVIHLEKIEKIRKKVKSALMYPAILLIVAFIVILIMLLKVVPVFQQMFSSMGHDLPGPTKAIITVSEFFRDPSRGGVLFLVLFVIFYSVKKLKQKNKNFKEMWDYRILKVPLIGDVIIKSTLSKIAMIMANLSAAGVSVIESLNIIGKSITNVIFLKSFEEIKRGVTEGKTLSYLFSQHEVFPATFHQMIAVGEETGRLDEMLESIASYYEEEFDMVVDRLTELLEPIMIVFMGVTVGFIIVAMYMPIFQIGNAVQ